MKNKTVLLILLTFLLNGCYQVDNLSTHIVPGDYIEGVGYLSPMNTIVSLQMYNKKETTLLEQIKKVSSLNI